MRFSEILNLPSVRVAPYDIELHPGLCADVDRLLRD